MSGKRGNNPRGRGGARGGGNRGRPSSYGQRGGTGGRGGYRGGGNRGATGKRGGGFGGNRDNRRERAEVVPREIDSVYDDTIGDEEEDLTSDRYDNVEVYEYQLPEDFEDEEIDEDEAFDEEDMKKWGSKLGEKRKVSRLKSF